MKKFLSLVLALVMTFSLVTVSAGAKEYTDKSTIKYADAVDVISTLGIVDGYATGAFNPSNTLTRGAAAKIICNMVLGPTTASALGANSAPFTDVPANHTFAGYIAYCSQQGIINGYSDGTFKPAGTVTGYQFMKMLLGALGYKAADEGFTGPNWTINVAKLALGLGLNKGNTDFVGSKAMTREEACLYAFNTLQATMVEYGNTTTITGSGINVSISGQAKEVAQGTVYKNIFPGKASTLEFAERYFADLKVVGETDDFGRPAKTWSYKNSKIGTYAKDATLTYTSEVKLGDIYKDLGLSKADKTDTYYVDGKEQSVRDANGTITKDNNLTIARGSKATTGGNGVLTEVYYDSSVDPATLEIVQINTYVATVGSVKAATASADRKITLTAKSHPTGTVDYGFETESFAQKDLVTYTVAYNETSSKYEVKSVEALAKTDAGTLTAFVGTDAEDASSNFTVNGTKYSYSKNANVKNGPIDKLGLKADLDVYCDQYGYAIYVEATKTATKYALVLGVGATNPYGDETIGATLLLADGTQVTATVKMADKSAAFSALSAAGKVNDAAAILVTYTVGSNGTYTLTKVDDYQAPQQGATTYSVTNGKSNVTLGGNNLYATSATVYFVCTKSGSDYNYKVYTGYAAMPTVNAAASVQYDLDGTYTTQVNAAFLSTATVLGVEGTSTYILRPASVKVISEVDKDAYVELPAFVDGAVTTVKVAYTLVSGNGTLKNAGGYVVDSYTTSDDVITGVTLKTGTQSATGTVAVSNGVVGFGATEAAATYWAYRSDTKVVYVSSDGKTLSTGTVEGIATDANDTVVYEVDTNTKTVTNIYITVVD